MDRFNIWIQTTWRISYKKYKLLCKYNILRFYKFLINKRFKNNKSSINTNIKFWTNTKSIIYKTTSITYIYIYITNIKYYM